MSNLQIEYTYVWIAPGPEDVQQCWIKSLFFLLCCIDSRDSSDEGEEESEGGEEGEEEGEESVKEKEEEESKPGPLEAEGEGEAMEVETKAEKASEKQGVSLLAKLSRVTVCRT